MTEGEYKFDNSPLQVAYTNFAPDAQTNFDGLDEVVYKVKIYTDCYRMLPIFSFQRRHGVEVTRLTSLVLSAFDVSEFIIFP